MTTLLAATATAGVALLTSAGLLAHLDRRRPAAPATTTADPTAPDPTATTAGSASDGSSSADAAGAHPLTDEASGAQLGADSAAVTDVTVVADPSRSATMVDRRDTRDRTDGAENADGASHLGRGWRALWWIPALSVTLAIVLAYLWATPGLELVYQVRVVLFLSFLPFLAVIDHRERIVPNQLLLALLALRVPLWIWEAIVDVDLFATTLRAEAVTALVVLGFFYLMRALHRGGLGMGDVKLFALMPLFLGTQLGLSAILGSLVAAFAFAVWSLVTRRKSRTDTFAMVPAIAVGTIVAVLAVSIRGAL